MKPLTKQQKKLVEENHNLIYGFAKSRKLDIDHYYDILAIGLCKAAKIYDEDQCKFSTFAYRCMEIEIYAYWKRNIKKYGTIEEIALCDNHYMYKNGFGIKTLSTHDIVVNNIIVSAFLNTLSKKEKTIIELIMNGLQQKEIADMMNCTQQNISFFVKKVHKKWNKYMNKN